MPTRVSARASRSYYVPLSSACGTPIKPKAAPEPKPPPEPEPELAPAVEPEPVVEKAEVAAEPAAVRPKRKRKQPSYAEREAVRRETAALEPELDAEIAKVVELADTAHHASANVHHERAARYYALLSRIFAARATAIRLEFGIDERDIVLPEVDERPRRAGDQVLRPCTRARRP